MFAEFPPPAGVFLLTSSVPCPILVPRGSAFSGYSLSAQWLLDALVDWPAIFWRSILYGQREYYVLDNGGQQLQEGFAIFSRRLINHCSTRTLRRPLAARQFSIRRTRLLAKAYASSWLPP